MSQKLIDFSFFKTFLIISTALICERAGTKTQKLSIIHLNCFALVFHLPQTHKRTNAQTDGWKLVSSDKSADGRYSQENCSEAK